MFRVVLTAGLLLGLLAPAAAKPVWRHYPPQASWTGQVVKFVSMRNRAVWRTYRSPVARAAPAEVVEMTPPPPPPSPPPQPVVLVAEKPAPPPAPVIVAEKTAPPPPPVVAAEAPKPPVVIAAPVVVPPEPVEAPVEPRQSFGAVQPYVFLLFAAVVAALIVIFARRRRTA